MTASPEPGIVRLSHVCLNSSDLLRTESFYCGILQFKKVHEFINAAGERYGFILAAGNGTFVEFFRAPPSAAGMEGDRTFRHFCFQVGDIEAVAGEFRRHGFDVSVTIGRTDRVPQFWVHDPDGTAVEFHEYSNPDSPQYPYV